MGGVLGGGCARRRATSTYDRHEKETATRTRVRAESIYDQRANGSEGKTTAATVTGDDEKRRAWQLCELAVILVGDCALGRVQHRRLERLRAVGRAALGKRPRARAARAEDCLGSRAGRAAPHLVERRDEARVALAEDCGELDGRERRLTPAGRLKCECVELRRRDTADAFDDAVGDLRMFF